MKTFDLGPRLDGERYLVSLETDGERLAALAEGRLDVAVPSCPGWNVAELVWHVGRVHHLWSSIVAGGIQDRKDVVPPERPPRGETIAWYRANLTRTVDALRAADPATLVWTWAREKDVAWIRRRMAHETAIHRWDAGASIAKQAPIEPDIAADGVDEFLEFFISDRALKRAPELSVHLHATDVEGEWLARVRQGELEARRAHEKGDVAVRGRVSDLLLLLWGRLPEANVDVRGDRAALFAFLQLAELS